ncbi:hypothetical protein [Alcanivorax sp.]|uniref:hypothetical protein n=1 Tax=Alcanivorax sp. TaxID=1872427 RepID=UPI0025C07E18|nr:hypothetical protein [Alcanivorax sp.]
MTEQTPQSPIQQQPTTQFIQQEQQAPVKAGWILIFTCWLCYLVPIPGLGLLGMALNFAAFVVSIVVMTRGKVGMGILLLVASVLFSTAIYFVGLAVFAGAVNEVMNYQY